MTTETDILEQNNHLSDSQLAVPLFCQTKKTGDIWVLTDFREVNQRIKQKSSLLPRTLRRDRRRPS